jgi:hypothetical protein
MTHSLAGADIEGGDDMVPQELTMAYSEAYS